jgi:CubicO group peptidase (beta-lactamase class C family)
MAQAVSFLRKIIPFVKRNGGGVIAAILLPSAIGMVPALAQTPPSLGAVGQATLDASYAGWSATTNGMVAGFELPNGQTWMGAAGYVDASHTTPLTPDYQFRVASQTKTYVGTVVLQMVDQGLISLNQTVSQLLPTVNLNNASQITLRELLNMTSGVPNYLDAQSPTVPTETILSEYIQTIGQITYSPQTLIELSNQLPPTSLPGAKYYYSDTNYLLLGLIAQAASCNTASGCQTIGQLIQSRILTPLGLTNTYFPTNDQFTGPHASGYYVNPRTGAWIDFTYVQPNASWAAGAMISTPADELKWIKELTTNSAGLLSPSLQALRLAVGPVGTPGSPSMQYGLAIAYMANALNGAVLLGHNGSGPGWSSEMVLDTASNIDFVANAETDDVATVLTFLLSRNVDAAVTANGTCTSGSNDALSSGGSCQGANVRTGSLTVNGGTLSIAASGQSYASFRVANGIIVPAPKPVASIAFYGDGMAGLVLANGGSAVIAPGALLAMTGANSTAVRLTGTGGNLTVAGQVSTASVFSTAAHGFISPPGNLALDIGGVANTVVVTASGTVTGQVALGGNGNSYQVGGISSGDVTVGGSGNVVGGTGLITGTLANAGGNVVAPGTGGAGTLTVGAYAGNGGTLRLNLGPAGLTSALSVLTIASLAGDKLQLVRAAGTPDVVLPVLYAPQGISGDFASVDPDPGPAAGLAQSATTVTLATVSPGLFDAAADVAVGALQLQHGAIMDRLLGLPSVGQSATPIANGRGTAWISGVGNILDATAADGSDYHATASGVILGGDFRITPEVLAGFSYSHQSADARLSGSGSRVGSTSDVGGIYGAVLHGPFFAAADVLAGAGSDVLTRNVLVGSSMVGQTGRPADTRVAAGLTVGMSVPLAPVQLIPRFGLTYQDAHLNGYTETGPAPLAVGGVAAQQMRGEAVVSALREFPVGEGTLLADVQVGVAYTWSLGSGGVLATMQGFPQPFSLKVQTRSGAFALVGAQLQYRLKPALAVFAAYDGEVGGAGTSSVFSGGLRFAF